MAKKELTIAEKAEKMIRWIGEEADDDDICQLYDYVTGKDLEKGNG